MRPMALVLKQPSVLPGFGLTLGFALFYFSLIVLIPLSGLVIKTTALTWEQFWHTVTEPRAIASYQLTFGASFLGALINGVFGSVVAWVLERYHFPGRSIVDALVDLPSALPTAVAGIALTAIYSSNGWIGQFTEAAGLKIAYTPIGIVIALVFIGLPFTVRTVQPVLEALGHEQEEAAASLGASRFTTLRRVILPELLPALLTGFSLSFARALGEYGSVIFIAGNKPFATEIAPLLITIRLEEYDYNGAIAIAALLLAASFLCLLAINAIPSLFAHERRENRRG